MTYFFIFLIGICFGSFVNVLIYRVPQGISIISPRSCCDGCKKQLKFYENIPLLSYVFLGGRCKTCRYKISLLVPFVEFLCGFLAIFIAWRVGLNIQALFVFLTFTMLVALSFMDINIMQVPDSINFTALFFAFISTLFYNLEMAISMIQASLVMAGFLSLLRLAISAYKKQEALGEADIIVVATLGLILGIEKSFNAIFIASVIALPIAIYMRSKNRHRLAFVPFLSIGGLVALI